jgi:hypothetical protein
MRRILSFSLSWLGVLGGTLSAFSNLETLLKLADWARWLVSTWNQWVNRAWDIVLAVFHFDILPHARFQITMALMIIFMAIGTRLSTDLADREWSPGIGNLIRLNVVVAVGLYIFHSWFFSAFFTIERLKSSSRWVYDHQDWLHYGVYAAAIFVGVAHWPLFAAVTATIAAVAFSEGFQRAANSLPNTSAANEQLSSLLGGGISIFAGLLVLYLAPPKEFSYRIWQLVIGLALLFALNELSKSALDIAPPSGRG